jgi:hypothetical protein
MKKFYKYSIITILAVACVFSLTKQAMAATKVNLGTAESFAVLAGTAVTNVPTSVITGDVGLSPAAGSNYTGLTTAQVTGTIYAVDGSGPAGSVNNPSLLTTAKNDLTTAYTNAAGQTPTTTFVAGDNQLGGQTLTPGVYRFGHASTANITAASPLTLDAQGDTNAVFIFQATSDLITASNSVVQLVNGAQACNIFWQIGSSATLGTNSTFKGTIMALTDIDLLTGANIEGRALARNAATDLQSNTITNTACQTTGGGSGSSGGSVPDLPNAGDADKNSSLWHMIVPAGSVIVALVSLHIARKKHII